MAVGSEASGGDAERRTRLANERTYLAWWRTALTAFAVSLGAGKLVPAVTDDDALPYTLLGAGFALLGVALVIGAFVRQREVERAIDDDTFEPIGRGALAALSVAGVALGVGMLLLTVL
ncbi:MAG: YidH family protein [Solirubrobacterales bacterium]